MMALAYSVADYFILPSREDNLPNTMLESIASGTPIISFPIGDTKELLENSECGILANDISSDSLEEAIEKSILNKSFFKNENLVRFSEENFSIKIISEKYKNIYNLF